MRIVISSDLYWPTVNGVSTASHTLALGLAKRGHQVLVLAPSQTGEHYIEEDGDTEVVRLKSTIFPFYHNQIDPLPPRREIVGVSVPRLPIYTKNGFRICLAPRREITKALDIFKPDIIHNHMRIMIGQEVLRYSRLNNVPIVSTNHVMPENLVDNLKLVAPFSKQINRAIKFLGRAITQVDYIIMPTQSAIDMSFTKEELRHLKVPVQAVSNGINLSQFAAKKAPASIYAKYGLPKDQPIIMYFGRVDQEKHLGVLLEAFAHIRGVTGSSVVVVGAGTDEANLRERAKELRISSHVVFTGRVPDEDKTPLLQAATVYCMPSPVELQSISTLEAMACGQPVVAVDAGAVGELCQDGRNGYLCEKDNVDQIAVGLERILTNKTLRAKFAAESLAIAKTHDITNTLKQIEEIYQKTIKLRAQKTK
ncbi:MAG: glycosyltransferase [Candidatus Nomurabacteria bacterium]|jgi:glycosyltransferase involved in cell wall biosynthesis|nr:glycosyltransferase [Candidatus Nomurabacteria bacterium]